MLQCRSQSAQKRILANSFFQRHRLFSEDFIAAPRLNEAITAPSVFLIGPDNVAYGEVDREQALWFAIDQELDLVEVGPMAKPPVCRVLDYNKYLYEKEKQARKQRAHQRGAGEVKEVKLGYKTDEHDVDTKARRAIGFLERGNRVKVFMILRGREQAFGPQALERVEAFRQRVNAEYDMQPSRQGNRITTILKAAK